MRLVSPIGSALFLSCAAGRKPGVTSNKGEGTQSAIKAADATSPQAATSTSLTGQSAMLGVQITMRGANPVFRVNFECRGEPIAPRDISVDDPGYHGFEPTYHCLLRADPSSAWPKNTPGWESEYGKTVPGYRLQGRCEPLERGRKYLVDVGGPGVGDSVFVINEDGTVQSFEGTCRKANRNETSPP